MMKKFVFGNPIETDAIVCREGIVESQEKVPYFSRVDDRLGEGCLFA